MEAIGYTLSSSSGGLSLSVRRAVFIPWPLRPYARSLSVDAGHAQTQAFAPLQKVCYNSLALH